MVKVTISVLGFVYKTHSVVYPLQSNLSGAVRTGVSYMVDWDLMLPLFMLI